MTTHPEQSHFHVTVCHAAEARRTPEEIRILVEPSGPPAFDLQALDIDMWMPSLAPSQALLQWYAHDGKKWYEYYRRYNRELNEQFEDCERVRALACKFPLTLVYLEGERACNFAVLLKQHLERLECFRRWDAGWMIGGYTAPLRTEIVARGGLWFAGHKVWVMPDRESWQAVRSQLPGDF